MACNPLSNEQQKHAKTITAAAMRTNTITGSQELPDYRPNILGDPGATSRDDAIFSGERQFWRKSLFQGLKSPWALFLTKRVPEVSKSVPLIGQKNIFLANQRGDLAG